MRLREQLESQILISCYPSIHREHVSVCSHRLVPSRSPWSFVIHTHLTWPFTTWQSSHLSRKMRLKGLFALQRLRRSKLLDDCFVFGALFVAAATALVSTTSAENLQRDAPQSDRQTVLSNTTRASESSIWIAVLPPQCTEIHASVVDAMCLERGQG